MRAPSAPPTPSSPSGPRAVSLALAAAALAAALTACAGPDRVSAPRRDAPPPRASLELLGATGLPLLYDQASTATTTLTINLLDWPMEWANDFAVPQGEQWSVAEVVLPGAAVETNPTATQRIAIRADKGGEPGTPIYFGVLTPTSAQAGSPLASLTSYTYSLPSPVVLGAGTYWLTAQCDVHVFECGVGPVVGSATLVTLCPPDYPCGPTATWVTFFDLSHVSGLAPTDLAFALYGGVASAAAADAAAGLLSTLAGFALPAGTTTSLAAKLREVRDAIAAGDTAAACRALNDFISQARAQSGKKLTAAQADALIGAANELRALLGC